MGNFQGLASGLPTSRVNLSPDRDSDGWITYTFVLITCCVPCDYVPVRSWPLFRARELMQHLIESFTQEPTR